MTWARRDSRSSDSTLRSLLRSACRVYRLAVPSPAPRRLSVGSAARESPSVVWKFSLRECMQERAGSFSGARSVTVIGSESSLDRMSLMIGGSGFSQQEESGSSFATWQAMCTRPCGFSLTVKHHRSYRQEYTL